MGNVAAVLRRRSVRVGLDKVNLWRRHCHFRWTHTHIRSFEIDLRGGNIDGWCVNDHGRALYVDTLWRDMHRL